MTPTMLKDTDVMVGNRISYEVARRNVHIEVLEMKNRELVHKNNKLQAEKIRALDAAIRRQNARAHRFAWLVPVVGLVIFAWDLTGWMGDVMYDIADGLADINRHRVRRGSEAWDIAEGLKTR